MYTWIKNVKMVNHRNELEAIELMIKDDKIEAIGTDLSLIGIQAEKTIDGQDALITPGLVDVHVHLREPGFTYKETIQTGSEAAARGGFTTICAMPNTNPVPDTVEKFEELQALIKKDAVVKVLHYAPITTGLKSDELVNQPGLLAAGAFAFTNDGVGVQTAGTMYLAMVEAAKNNTAIVAHTEDDSLLFGGVMHKGKISEKLNLPGILSITEASQIARDVLLSEATGAHYHVCHVSTKESVRVIRDAKKAGIHVTAEVTPHHLLLSEEDIPSDTAIYKMNPPLRGTDDREALIEGLLDGTIDFIATDHAPHSAEEKSGSMVGAPFGIVGSETAFQLLYTHFVKTGKFTLLQLIDWMSTKPAEVFNLNAGSLEVGAPADLALFNLTEEEEIDAKDFKSLSSNTPFIGWKVVGNTVMTLVDGKVVYS
ncbi:dihydroorotase [Carnobacterium maltaromaticum]|jgi:dihydroorotase|uniref:Dihydroorotase n=1 Tax=Carnobacterium maltaromaticum LMA28 TaxID=1234679 RepID=K8E407_CARML|nr:dihydroorotase [Carnobacterium maltaromaticum]KRN64475.1 dihydroorotase [Carnobacterium maltaromaticum DSM 20342]KRN74344.1 dihydroorotase [Carnobacterium maltaromaticum]MBC9809464.1 dihydroorotase [Carnobacterium maltaromaticum]MCC4312211.1 dihydroorotase [Carnobacterium maltaromaticum]MCI1820001.1 dihydroorotase [Carnobacterium maltaromaticum]